MYKAVLWDFGGVITSSPFDAFNRLILRIEKGGRDAPPLDMLIPFQIFKYVAEIDRKNMPADYEYYKDKQHYFYDAKIPFHKKFIAKRVSDKITRKFAD